MHKSGGHAQRVVSSAGYKPVSSLVSPSPGNLPLGHSKRQAASDYNFRSASSGSGGAMGGGRAAPAAGAKPLRQSLPLL